jgi:hypothetical protein
VIVGTNLETVKKINEGSHEKMHTKTALLTILFFGQDNCRAMALKLSGAADPLLNLKTDVVPIPQINSTDLPLGHNL